MSFGRYGSSKVAALLYILLAGLLVHAVVKTAPPFISYYSMDDEVSQQLRLSAINSDEIILSDLVNKAVELDLPIRKADIRLVRGPGSTVAIGMKWSVKVDYGRGFIREFPFEINATTERVKG